MIFNTNTLYIVLGNLRDFLLGIRSLKTVTSDLVKRYYGYNTEKAQQAMRILTQDQIEVIRSKLDTGGRQ